LSVPNVCPACGAANAATHSFCINCGARLPASATGTYVAPPTGYPVPYPAPAPYPYPSPYPYYAAPPPPRARFSDILSGMFDVWTKNFVDFFLVYIVLALVTGALQAGAAIAIFGSFAGGGFLPGASAPTGVGIEAVVLFAVASVVLSVILASIVVGGMTEYAVRRFRGEPMPLQRALRRGLERFLSILGANVLLTLIVFALVLLPIVLFIPVLALGGGDPSTVLAAICGLVLALIIGGVVAVWLYIALSLFAPAIMMENAGAIDGLSRSWRLTKGHRWSIFGATVITAILTAVISGAITLPAAFLGNPIVTILAAALASGIVGPLFVILAAVAYDLILRLPAPVYGAPPPYGPPSYPYSTPFVPPASPPQPPPASPPPNP
jgi:hypothetical protein